jgi:hypothetical protein
MVRFILHTTNVALILAMIGCTAGALAGLIVLLPFVAGAWGLNLMALVAHENRPARGSAAAAEGTPVTTLPEPTRSPDRRPVRA